MREVKAMKNRVASVLLGLAVSMGSVGLAAAPVKESQTPPGYDQQAPVKYIERISNIPERFKLRDWHQVARDYVHFVFDMDAKGEFLPLCWWDKMRRNFDEDTFGMYVVVNEGRGGPNRYDGEFHEGINDLATIRSGLLVGVDMRKLHGKDWVRMARAYFNKANGRNVFMDYTSERVQNLGGNYGRSFWMDIMPTLYYGQILSLCPEDPELSGLWRTSADQFCAAVEIMKKTPEGFDWTTFDFKTMKPVYMARGGGPKQPDSAGGFAYVGCLAHKKFGDAKYLAMAKDSLDYLDSQTVNPLQETLLPYGAFTAARLNAEQGTSYDVPKLVSWCFGPGRKTIGGIITGKEGKRLGYSLEGLIVNTGGQVYLYETFELANSMVPLVRYDQRLARAVGKWMLSAASNARLFYPQEIPDELQATPQFKDFSRNLLAYEALHRQWMGEDKKTMGFKATRDSWGDKWHPVSHLSLYSTAAVGTFGAIIRPTSDEKILQLDCLATDFYRNKAYPTFLYYNPYTEAKSVTIDVGNDAVDLYDIVGKRLVAQGVSGNKVALTLAADSAAVIVRIPAGTKLEKRDGKLYGGDTVVDFRDRQGADGGLPTAQLAAPSGPIRTSLTAEPSVSIRPVPPKVPLQAAPFDLRDVQLLDGPFKHAQDLNRKLLMEMEFDKLVHPFRQVAGIPSPVNPKWWMFGIDNQHTCGHWLSAAAMHIRNTGDVELKKKADAVVAAIAECQAKIGTGYISGFSEEALLVNEGLVKNKKGCNVPWYHLHKVYAGLLDMYELTGNQQALEVLRKAADWAEKNTDQLNDAKMEWILGTEHGGIAEVVANLYAATGEERYLKLARRFLHRGAIMPFAQNATKQVSGHANTAIPKFSSAARLYELTGEPGFQTSAINFWKLVVDTQTYVTGGNCYAEYFSPNEYFSLFVGSRTIESCNEYNMLKLTRHLFRETPEPGYADYFERTLYNNVLAVRHPENAALIYYVPMQSGNHKGDTRNQRHMPWRFPLTPPSVDATKFGGEGACCAGTGMESNARYQDGIYYHAGEKELYVNLFIASVLNWKDKGIKLRQETKFPEESKSVLVFDCPSPTALTLKLRRPWWATQDFQVRINGEKQEVASKPGSYAQVERTWKSGDRVEVVMPQSFYLDGFKDNPKRVALMYGPLVMAAETEYGNIWSLLVAENLEFLKAIKPVEGKPLEFTAPAEVFRTSLLAVKDKPVVFRPLLTTVNNPYAVYWDMMTPAQFEKEAGQIVAERQRQKELEPRTVDLVLCKDPVDESFTVQEYFLTQPGWLARPADQVSEKAHGMKAQKGPQRISPRGRWLFQQMFYGMMGACRILEQGDAVTYQMAVRPEGSQKVSVRLWKSFYTAKDIPAKQGKLEVLAGERLLGSGDVAQMPCNAFSEMSFPLQEDLVKGKESLPITVRAVAGPVCSLYECRTLKD